MLNCELTLAGITCSLRNQRSWMFLQSAFTLLPLVCPGLGLVLYKFLERKFPEPTVCYMQTPSWVMQLRAYIQRRPGPAVPSAMGLRALGIPFISPQPRLPICQLDTCGLPACISSFIPARGGYAFSTCSLRYRLGWVGLGWVFWLHPGPRKVPGLGIKSELSWNLHHSYGNAGSWTHCIRTGLELVLLLPQKQLWILNLWCSGNSYR